MNLNLDFSGDYQQLCSAFDHIRGIKSQSLRRYTLNRISTYFGLPRAELRKLYEIYCDENPKTVAHFPAGGGAA